MRATTAVIGAGHAGLAVSHHLSSRSIDHVVIERGDVANTWRTERWDSLRLLTPNWQSRMPGFAYDGDDPDGFMTIPEVIAFIETYAATLEAPVLTGTTVTAVRRSDDGYDVVTDDGVSSCPTVVIATGGFNRPTVPAAAGSVPGSVDMVTPFTYHNPSQLRDGGVLVVGAAATGIQIAEEIQRSGRPVTLAVGEHVRMPRTYRGRDIQWWMERSGRLDERYDEVDDILRARHVPSPQLVGTPERRTVDLNTLTADGVVLVGRVAGVADGKVQLSGSLRNMAALADLKLGRLLGLFDEWATENGLDGEVEDAHRLEPTRVPDAPPLSLDLDGGDIATIVWATGFAPDHSWLDMPVFDHRGRLRHDGGVVTDAPGLYRIGLNFLRRRKSSFIHGADDDARDLVDHLAAHLENRHASSTGATRVGGDPDGH